VKKPALALVIGKGDDDEAIEGKADDSGEYSAVIGELFDALKDGDREAFSEAFQAAVMSCKE
jgi:hypothetical protein